MTRSHHFVPQWLMQSWLSVSDSHSFPFLVCSTRNRGVACAVVHTAILAHALKRQANISVFRHIRTQVLAWMVAAGAAWGCAQGPGTLLTRTAISSVVAIALYLGLLFLTRRKQMLEMITLRILGSVVACSDARGRGTGHDQRTSLRPCLGSPWRTRPWWRCPEAGRDATANERWTTRRRSNPRAKHDSGCFRSSVHTRNLSSAPTTRACAADHRPWNTSDEANQNADSLPAGGAAKTQVPEPSIEHHVTPTIAIPLSCE